MNEEQRSEPKTPASVYFLLGVVVLVWSINFVVGKFALRQIPDVLLGTLRFTVAAAMLTPYYVFERRRRKLPLIEKGGIGKLMAVGLVGVGANQLCFLLGLSRTSVAHAAILFALTPMIVLLVSAAAGMERITAKKVGGIVLAIAGVGLLQTGDRAGREATLLGDAFIAAAVATFSIFTVGGKWLRKDFDTLTITTGTYLGSAILLSPVTLLASRNFDFAGVSWSGWAAVFYMALFPSIIAYMIYYHALHYLDATQLSLLAYLQPVMATVFGVTLLDERITPGLLAGGALILAGVFVAERT
ncbi:MAG: DMT family transporter [Bryobacteraceae bacterium]